MLRFVWSLGGLALILGFLRDPALALLPPPRELPRADGATGRPWITGDFIPVQGLQTIAPGELAGKVHVATSWLGDDAAQGRAVTAWFRTSAPSVHVGVAGYPRHAGLQLWAEFRAADDSLSRFHCPLPDPMEEWSVWTLARPANAVAVRIVAEDRSSETYGWIAFSHPFRTSFRWAPAAYECLQVCATLALVLVLAWGPGLLWTQRGWPPELTGFVVLATGPLLLCAGGVLIWCFSGAIDARFLGAAVAGGLWLAIGVSAARRELTFAPLAGLPRVLVLAALVAAAVAAKSTFSVGPEGETFRGTISRNLAAGDRLDSRFAFYTVQAAAHHRSPTAPAVEALFHPWNFFSRGPLAGLAATPIALATGGRPTSSLPGQRWSPFDREGFAAYRLTLIVLAAGILPACFLALAPLLGEAWALAAGGFVALAPFGVHEIMFTWPKWAATAWLVVGFALCHARRAALAGLALGLGFLYHPLALLWAPWLALWLAGRTPRKLRPTAADLARFAAGVAVLVVPWFILGRLLPHSPSTPLAGQGSFLTYWLLADSHLANWTQWCHARWQNFANTFLPLHLVLSDFSFHHPHLNSTYEPSGALVKFAFVWWNTLPFGLGLGLWLLSLAACARAWRVLRAATVLFVVGPAALAVLYWGMDPLGLLRECGHPLVVAIIALTCAAARTSGAWWARQLAHPAVPWLQLPETLLMLWLTTLLNPRPWAALHADLDALALAANILLLLAAARLLSRSRPPAVAPPPPG
ncbi:MAG: hypothetical protein FJ399_11290 [Verrucomicrobia bacterium]|nr:hypothetical protein [Verrucomicrobiota bacterium]